MCHLQCPHGTEAPVACPGTPSPVLMFLLLPCWGELPRASLALFPCAIETFIAGECFIQNGMERKSPWLLALLIFIMATFRRKDLNWYRLHQVAEQNSWYQHRNFYEDNHICITTCASTTWVGRSWSLPAGCQRQPTKGLCHPGSADTPRGCRSLVS